MKTWKTFNPPEAIIKKELRRSIAKKNGKAYGVYYRKNHAKKFHYRKRNAKERERAKNKAIELIKLDYWKKKYITDFPEPTEEFIYSIKNFDFEKVYKVIDKINYINLLQIDAEKNRYHTDQVPSPELIQVVKENLDIDLDLKNNLPVYAHLWMTKQKISSILYESLEPILDDRYSNYKSGSHGRKRYVPKALEKYIIDRDKGICQHCSTVPEVSRIDHVIPVTLGGPSAKWNLQLLCRKCNQIKLHYLIVDDIKKAISRLKDYIY